MRKFKKAINLTILTELLEKEINSINQELYKFPKSININLYINYKNYLKKKYVSSKYIQKIFIESPNRIKTQNQNKKILVDNEEKKKMYENTDLLTTNKLPKRLKSNYFFANIDITKFKPDIKNNLVKNGLIPEKSCGQESLNRIFKHIINEKCMIITQYATCFTFKIGETNQNKKEIIENAQKGFSTLTGMSYNFISLNYNILHKTNKKLY